MENNKEFITKLLCSRLRILNSHGFYGALLSHLQFGISNMVDTAYTNGYKICFNPNFLESLTNDELDFILMHEIMHIVLKHCFRGVSYKENDADLFNIACDIVVNSNILKSFNADINKIKIKGKNPLHLTPGGQEGYLFTAEEVFKQLKLTPLADKKASNFEKQKAFNRLTGNKDNKNDSSDIDDYLTDDHEYWEELVGDNDNYIDTWDQRLMNAVESEKQKEKITGNSDIPLAALREYDKLTDSKVNWKEILNDFLTFEINDYSFTPPDRRIEGPFFMPDFNAEEEVLKEMNVFVAIDTSGSIDKESLTKAVSEIKGAIETSNNKFKGWLAYFDAKLYDILPFESLSDVLKMPVKGGGGTSFKIIFEGLEKFKSVAGEDPDIIIIITDGYASYPDEKARKNIPTLWLINNKDVTPPWGMIARF